MCASLSPCCRLPNDELARIQGQQPGSARLALCLHGAAMLPRLSNGLFCSNLSRPHLQVPAVCYFTVHMCLALSTFNMKPSLQLVALAIALCLGASLVAANDLQTWATVLDCYGK
jgi:hypothetical protein